MYDSTPGELYQALKQRVEARRARRSVQRAALPWAELEAEAARQGCSPADIFFDRAGRGIPGLTVGSASDGGRELPPPSHSRQSAGSQAESLST